MWEINQENMWIKRNEKRHIVARIDIDEGHFTSKPIVTFEILGKRPKKKMFDDFNSAIRYTSKLMKKHQ